MTEKITTLKNLKSERDIFNPETDIGVWVHIDPETKLELKNGYKEIGTDGYEMVDNALLLDIPVELLEDRKTWEERIQEYLKPIHECFFGEVGSGTGRLRTFTTLVGGSEESSPKVAVFFDAILDRPTDPTDTDYILMFVATRKFNHMTDKPKEWGVKNKIPEYNRGNLLPNIKEVLK